MKASVLTAAPMQAPDAVLEVYSPGGGGEEEAETGTAETGTALAVSLFCS